MTSIENLHDLFVREIRDLYDAEQQLVASLPLLVQAANAPELKKAMDGHRRETQEHVERLEQIFRALDTPAAGRSCKAMQGLIAEAKDVLDEDIDPDVLDAALIVGAQKIEHYEIAGYGSVCTFARMLQYTDAARVLAYTLSEEESADRKLTQLAGRSANPRAESADQAAT